MSVYYQLWCVTCNQEFKPLVSTEPGEMLNPDYPEEECSHCGQDAPAPAAGWSNMESLRHFHKQHSGHQLEEREYKLD